MLLTVHAIETQLKRGFPIKQARLLSEVIVGAHSELVKADDFNELKDIVKELAEAQKGSEKRLTRLEAAVEELAEAQKRTEEAVKELAEAQKRTEKSISDQITALGSRWGIYNEATFRATIRGILGKQKGVEVKSGYYGDREVDVIIRDGEHIILEITSRLKTSDVDNLIASGEDYKKRHGVEPLLMAATSYISPKLMQRIIGLPKKIEVFSYEGEEE
jgi:hypothetical protein